jgi:hypothetical protein
MTEEGCYSPKVQELGALWEANQTLTPEELCKECPEYLYELKEALKHREFGRKLEEYAGVELTDWF